MATVIREYDAKLDSRDRLVLRDAEFEHYHVVMYDDGSVRLEPRVLAHPGELSARTLQMMDRSVASLEQGKTGEAVDFSRYRALLDEDDE